MPMRRLFGQWVHSQKFEGAIWLVYPMHVYAKKEIDDFRVDMSSLLLKSPSKFKNLVFFEKRL